MSMGSAPSMGAGLLLYDATGRCAAYASEDVDGEVGFASLAPTGERLIGAGLTADGKAFVTLTERGTNRFTATVGPLGLAVLGFRDRAGVVRAWLSLMDGVSSVSLRDAQERTLYEAHGYH